MRFRFAGRITAGLALLALPVLAQDAPPPPIYQVTTLELAPATMGAFRSGMARQAAAAKELNLPAAEAGWWTYSEGNRLIIVAPRTRDAVLGRPAMGTRARIRAANPGLDSAIDKAYGGAQSRLVSQELIVEAPNLSYTAATQVEVGAIQVADIIIAPGQGQAFNEAVQAMNKVRTDIGYPYTVLAFRVRFGETRTQLVTLFDSREAFFGKNSIDRLLAGKPEAQAAWQVAIGKIVAAVESYEFTLSDYSANLSYPAMP